MNSINNRSKLSLLLAACALFAGCAFEPGDEAAIEDTGTVEQAGTWTKPETGPRDTKDRVGPISCPWLEYGACTGELMALCREQGGNRLAGPIVNFVSNGDSGCPDEGRRSISMTNGCREENAIFSAGCYRQF